MLAGGGWPESLGRQGFCCGIADESPAAAPALLESDVLVGTSAGSAVVAQLGSGLRAGGRCSRGKSPRRRPRSTPASTSTPSPNCSWPPWRTRTTTLHAAAAAHRGGRAGRRNRCRAGPARGDRAAAAVARTGPSGCCGVTAIDTATGELVVFDRDSGVELVDAVAASCAVPGAWPPVTIADRRYMDGGIGSSVNLGVADDCGAAVVLVPSGDSTRRRRSAPGPAAEIAAFAGRGVGASSPTTSRWRRSGPTRWIRAAASARRVAGREQGRREAAAVARFLGV